MSIIVLLSPIHFFFFIFSFSELHVSFINKKHYILNSKGDYNYLPFQKTNKSINK